MSFEYQYFEYLSRLKSAQSVKPLNLGGVSSSGGGIGGPPGGFLGYLPQIRVAFDESELASSFTPTSGESLLDNLNHIRYRLQELESGVSFTGINVLKDDILLASGILNLNISTNMDVTVLGDTATLTSSGGSGSGGHTIQDSTSSFTQRTNLKFTGSLVGVSDDPLNNATVVNILSPSGEDTALFTFYSDGVLVPVSGVSETFVPVTSGSITKIVGHLKTLGSGTTTIDINKNGVSILNDKLTFTSENIDIISLSEPFSSSDIFSLDIDDVGSGTSSLTVSLLTTVVSSGGSSTTTSGGTITPDFYSWNPDAPPTTSNAKDDEFDDSSFNSSLWTVFDLDDTLTVEEDARGLVLKPSLVTQDKIIGVVQEVPASDYTAWTKVHLIGVADADSKGGIILLENLTNTSKMITFGSMQGWNTTFQAFYWSDPYTGDTIYTNESYTWMGMGMYFRYRQNGTIGYLEASNDGVGWLLINTIDPLPFTPAYIGLYTHNNSEVHQVCAIFDFFRIKDGYDMLALMEGNTVKGFNK